MRVGLASTTFALLLAIPRASWAQSTETSEWRLTDDKALHFTISAGVASVSYAALVPLTESRATRLALSSSFALLVGTAKETADLLGAGDPSWADLAFDAGGVATGALLAWGLDLLLEGPRPKSERVHVAPPLRLIVDF